MTRTQRPSRWPSQSRPASAAACRYQQMPQVQTQIIMCCVCLCTCTCVCACVYVCVRACLCFSLHLQPLSHTSSNVPPPPTHTHLPCRLEAVKRRIVFAVLKVQRAHVLQDVHGNTRWVPLGHAALKHGARLLIATLCRPQHSAFTGGLRRGEGGGEGCRTERKEGNPR